MKVRICIAIREESMKAAGEAILRASRWADLVEVRADYIRDLDPPGLFRNRSCPLLFTLRPRREGGEYEGDEEKRIRVLIDASRAGADWIDVEFSAAWRPVLEKVSKGKVVLSYHNFEETPDNLEVTLDSMASTGAGILKIATRAWRLSDNLKIARLLRHAASKGMNLIALAMGREGIPSRVLGPHWGSWMTFASLPGSAGTAEGQIPAHALVHEFRIRSIGSGTDLFGVLGRPLGHSLSPQIHNAAFGALNRDAVYMPLEAADLEDFREFESGFGLRGCSVTIPYKEQALALAQNCSETVRCVGALNTLVRTRDGWHGENTDVEGFLRPIRNNMNPAGSRVIVLGCGGAARAAVYGLRSQEASVCVAARKIERARLLAESLGADHIHWDRIADVKWDLLVNATPVGMHPNVDESPVPSICLTGKYVYDLVYNPVETRLLREARRAGCRTIGGMEMFLGQALEQQRAWFGEAGPEDVMRAAMNEALVTP